MRALSHYWRVTRQDNVVAQALLEKAISIDPNYGQALGLLASSHTFCAHYGLGRHRAGDGGRGARRAGWRSAPTARTLGRITRSAARFSSGDASTIRWPSSSLRCRLNANFSLGQGYYGLALAYCGRWQEGNEAALRAIRLSPRDPFAAVYYGIAAYAQFVGRNYEEAIKLARERHPPARRLRRRPPRTDGGGRHGRTDRAGATERFSELRRAQPNVSLAWIAANMPIRDDAEREHYLEGFRRAGLE